MSKQYLKYGLTLEEYNALLELCQNRCMICGAAPKNRALAIDHNHQTGKVRGLLCMRCNRRIISSTGDLPNAVDLFLKAAEYINNHNKGLPSKRRQKADKIFKFSDR